LSLLSNVERLDIRGDGYLPPDWQENMNSTQWIDLLRPFIAVARLHISERLGPLVVDALQELAGERTHQFYRASEPFLRGDFCHPYPASEKR